MPDSMEQFRRELEKLKVRYRDDLERKLEAILEAWEKLLAAPGPARLEELHRLVHTLCGSSATFGFPDISAAARTVEVRLKALKEAGSQPDDRERGELADMLDSLSRTVRGNTDAAPAHVPPPAQPAPVRPAASAGSHRALIHLLQEDPESGQELAAQLAHFGYAVSVFSTPEELHAASLRTRPSAVIVTCTCMDRELLGVTESNSFSTERTGPPLIIVAAQEDFESRLAAVRVGAAAYFTEPVNISALVERLDLLTVFRDTDPFRIVIVDDDPEVARHFETLLQTQGWLTRIVSRPEEVLSHISEFRPDIILMDLYMPRVNGVELAKVIRQRDVFLSIPIVFLSAETDPQRQLQAVRPGADDFLTKGIHPEILVGRISTRVKRYRSLRRLLSRDSLTGLLNHTSLKTRLETEISRAERQNTRLAFAMIDLDHFKQVNDTYGHPAGDLVLKSLAKLLTQRLRKADVIGRYGGEEFGVILLDIQDAEAAYALMDGIRRSFAGLVHHADGESFHVTFSCGVAMFPEFPDATSISDAADKALYEAKNAGRNRVFTARPE